MTRSALGAGTLAVVLLGACSDAEPSMNAAGGDAGTAAVAGAGASSGASAGGASGSSNVDRGGEPSDGGVGGRVDLPTSEHDLVVYGCTSAGVMAAVQAKAMQKSVILVCPETYLGGLSTQGLGWTDTGDKSVIGGLSRGFYARIKQTYDDDARWKQQTKSQYSHYDADADTMWVFEPHVAEELFEAIVTENQLEVKRDEWLDRAAGVTKDGGVITAITTLSGERYAGKMFIDATYEGDLMAAANVSFTVGREGNAKYGETLNGVQVAAADSHQFTTHISPYVVEGDPTSGLLPRISSAAPGTDGEGDQRVQAYNYRVCLTNDASNRQPFPKPDG